jgi:hypothetical protein
MAHVNAPPGPPSVSPVAGVSSWDEEKIEHTHDNTG